MKMHVVLTIAAAAIIGGAAATAAVVASDTAPASTVANQLASTDLQAELMISLAPQGSTTAAAIGRDEAMSIASGWLGRSDSPALVVHGAGRTRAADQATDAWIVVYAGGEPPPGDAASSTVVDFVGVLVSDDTGAVLRTFGKGHQP